MRDMTDREFRVALARHGFKIPSPGIPWIAIGGGRHAGMVFDAKPRGGLRVNLRASLAWAIRRARELDAK